MGSWVCEEKTRTTRRISEEDNRALVNTVTLNNGKNMKVSEQGKSTWGAKVNFSREKRSKH